MEIAAGYRPHISTITIVSDIIIAPSTEPRIRFWVEFTYLLMGFVGGGGALRQGQHFRENR